MHFQLFRNHEGERSRLERGQAMVEVALLLPFIFVLLLMVIEFGFLMWSHLNVNASAREAARFAAVGNRMGEEGSTDPKCPTTDVPSPKTVRGRAVEVSMTRLKCDEVIVTYRNTTSDPGGPFIGRGDEVVVEVNHPYLGLTPLVNMMASFGFGGPTGQITLHACADARLERTYGSDAGLLQSEPLGHPATASCG